MTRSTPGADFRRAYDAEYEFDTPADAVVLDRVCALLDQIAEMESQITSDGYVVRGGNGQPSANPLLAAVRAHTSEVSRLVRQLKLEPESITTTRARKAANARWERA